MEAYYKNRKKELNKYHKIIKRLSKDGKVDELKQIQKEYFDYLVKPPLIKRNRVLPEEEVLTRLKKTIRDKETKFIQLKLDLCYDLQDSMKEYDSYEKEIIQLRKKYDQLLSQKRQRELLEERTKKQQQEKMKGLLESYVFLQREDKKDMYEEIQKISSEMSNPMRKVYADNSHGEMEYRLTQLYEPLVTVKISD
jgi:hypothetical protein